MRPEAWEELTMIRRVPDRETGPTAWIKGPLERERAEVLSMSWVFELRTRLPFVSTGCESSTEPEMVMLPWTIKGTLMGSETDSMKRSSK